MLTKERQEKVIFHVKYKNIFLFLNIFKPVLVKYTDSELVIQMLSVQSFPYSMGLFL